MKSILKHTIFNSISLYLLTLFLPGVRIYGDLEIFLLSGFILTILYKIIKPVLSIISMPLNVISLGLFSFILNAILLYLLTIFIPNINITSFTFNGFEFAGFIIPVMHFSSFWAFIVSAFILSLLINFFDWLTK